MHRVRPHCFVKWAGGKTSLLPTLLECVPKQFGTYFEPFVGGGALFFALKRADRIKRACLNDSNSQLIAAYKVIKSDVEVVMHDLRKMKNEVAYYYRMRARYNSPTDTHSKESLFIYLNKTCFNGLHRVNKENKFNVPFGKYANPLICDEENLIACSAALRNTQLHSRDFQSEVVQAGDFVYFDPPYLPRLKTDFTAYGPDKFSFDDHVRLRDHALMLKKRGAHVLISNSGSEDARELYSSRQFKIREVQGRRSISAGGEHRGYMPDLLIT